MRAAVYCVERVFMLAHFIPILQKRKLVGEVKVLTRSDGSQEVEHQNL